MDNNEEDFLLGALLYCHFSSILRWGVQSGLPSSHPNDGALADKALSPAYFSVCYTLFFCRQLLGKDAGSCKSVWRRPFNQQQERKKRWRKRKKSEIGKNVQLSNWQRKSKTENYDRFYRLLNFDSREQEDLQGFFFILLNCESEKSFLTNLSNLHLKK